MSELRLDVLPKATVRAFKKCSEIPLFSQGGWYLAGGTALALQVGHRQSVDLDFFTIRRKVYVKNIEETLSIKGEWTTSFINEGTLYGIFEGGKISFISYPFFRSHEPLLAVGTVSLLAPADIAVMKIVAIAQRGRKRDFFDLYWLCHNVRSLAEIIESVNSQYNIAQNPTHILKSLVYFVDAESDPEPIIYFDATWKKVKSFFTKEIPVIADKIMR